MNAETLSLLPLTGSTAAEILDLDLREITPQQFAAVRDAFHANCMLVFRNQRLGAAELLAFTRHWGEVFSTKHVPGLDGFPEVIAVRNRGNAGRRLYFNGGDMWDFNGKVHATGLVLSAGQAVYYEDSQAVWSIWESGFVRFSHQIKTPTISVDWLQNTSGGSPQLKTADGRGIVFQFVDDYANYDGEIRQAFIVEMRAQGVEGLT